MTIHRFSYKFELTEGDIHTPNFILPFIQRTATLKNEQFKDFMGIDLEREEDRKRYLEILIKSHLNHKG